MTWVIYGEDEEMAVREMKDMSDRAAAIVAASMLESAIEELLQSILLDTKKSTGSTVLADIFRNSGPLGSFSAKIDLSLMLGICSRDAWKDLDTIREIRNAFAHKVEARGFKTQRLAALCANLKAFEPYVFPRGMKDEDTPSVPRKLFETDLPEKLSDPRQRYLLAIRYLLFAFRMVAVSDTKQGLFARQLC